MPLKGGPGINGILEETRPVKSDESLSPAENQLFSFGKIKKPPFPRPGNGGSTILKWASQPKERH